MNDESLAHTLARVRIDSHPQWTRSVSPYTLIRRYWNASKADAARAELVALMKRECSERAEGGDTRTLGASRLARRRPRRYPLILEFALDPLLRRAAAQHLSLNNVTVDTLASVTRPGAASGGGWHVDQHERGFKAIMYLDDVDEFNGPFAVLLDYAGATIAPLPGRLGRRFGDAAIARAVHRGARVVPLHAPRGSVILFETSSIHRGLPCARGTRHSITNYYANTPGICGLGGGLGGGPGHRIGPASKTTVS